MTTTQASDVLRKAFGVFTEAEKVNVRWHLKRGTPILCSLKARLFTSSDGGL